MSESNTPEFHIADRGFKFLLESSESKVRLLELISPDLVKDLDVASIRASKTGVVEPSFREIIEDVAFEVKQKTNGETLRYLVIVAHQSNEDKFMPFRILRTMTGYWSEELRVKSKPKMLKHIRPILVYTGEKRWDLDNSQRLFERCFSGLAHGGDKAAEVPLFRIRSLNLGNLKTSELLDQNTELGFGLALYRAQFGSEFNESRDRILATLKSNSLGLTDDRQTQYLHLLFQLTSKNQTEEISRELVNRSLSILEHERYRKMVKTYEQTLIERGIEQGRVESLRESIIVLILKRFPEVSESEAREKLLTVDKLGTLQFIHNRVFDWESYQDVWSLPED